MSVAFPFLAGALVAIGIHLIADALRAAWLRSQKPLRPTWHRAEYRLVIAGPCNGTDQEKDAAECAVLIAQDVHRAFFESGAADPGDDFTATLTSYEAR